MSRNSLLVLNRTLSLKELSPFLLLLDSLAQSAYYLLEEIGSKNTDVTFVSFETVNRPKWALNWVEGHGKTVEQLLIDIQPHGKQQLVVIDTLNYYTSQQLTQLVLGIIAHQGTTLAGVFHQNSVNGSGISGSGSYSFYPSELSMLCYIASTILEVEPIIDPHDEELLDSHVQKLQFPVCFNVHSPQFALTLHFRRKSGRTLTYRYRIDADTHQYETAEEKAVAAQEDEGLLRDLTTFNLATSSKQKAAREQVELPFLQAQEALGSAGGAIVYEFEKDDDYDEEDPYEDPF